MPVKALCNLQYIELQMRVAQAGALALKSVNGREFTVGTSAHILYQSSGTSRDYAYDVPHIPYSFTFELYPKSASEGGFVVSQTQIEPSGREIYAAVHRVFSTIPL